ncbi:MAG: aldo/keto reductase [Clostridiales Family XIII bacterium]|nr:aldo/keto reductase [Clostridiales Family XIII bacterium]
MKRNKLGGTGIEVSAIGFGALPIGFHQLDLAVDEGAGLVRYALERGISFIDSAEYYRTYPYIRAALKGGGFAPVISTKSLRHDRAGMAQAVEEARSGLDRDVIDVFLLHEVRHGGDFARRRGAWEYLLEAKAKGLIRAAGISTHHTDVALEAALNPEVDALFALINHKSLGIRKGDGPGSKEEMAEAIDAASGRGAGVYAMKALGGGNLLGDYAEALDYVRDLPGVASTVVGFGARHEIDRIAEYAEGRLDKGYKPDTSRKRFRVVQGDCAGCGLCVARCPGGAIFYNSSGLAEVDQGSCLQCGYCAPVCPTRALVFY